MAVVKYKQHSFNAGVISPLLYTRVAQDRYRNSCIELHNMLLYPQGGVYRRSGMEYLGSVKGKTRLVPFVYNTRESYILEFGNWCMRVWSDGELVRDRSGRVVEFESPYSYDVLYSVQYTQTENNMYLVSPYVRPHVLHRISYNKWQFKELLFGAEHAPPNEIQATGGVPTVEPCLVVIRSLDKKGRESRNSEVFKVHRRATGERPMEYTWSVNGNDPQGTYYIYVKEPNDGYFKMRGSVMGTRFVDAGMPFEPSYKLSKALGPYNGEGNYPSAVALWQQRLIFAGSLMEPQTIWFSKVADYNNFFHTPELPDDDPITVTISSTTAEPIQWIYTHRDLLFIGTALGEWSVSAYSGKSLTPRTVSVRRHTSYGTSAIPPLHVGDAMVFVQRDKKVLRQLQYLMEYDSFVGNDLSILAEHITNNTMVRTLVWQQYPNPILWVLLENGTLAGLTFIQDYGIFAWHTHSTQGDIESIVGIPTQDETEIYAVVKRIIGGEECRYLERFKNPVIFQSVEEGRFLDSFIEYVGEATDVLQGLEHLEGEKVYALADGNIEQELCVEHGSITLTKPAKTVCVGLPYTSKLHPSLSLLPQAEGKEDRLYSVISLSITSTHDSPFYISNGMSDVQYPSRLLVTEQKEEKVYTYKVIMPPQYTRTYNIILQQYMPVQMVITSVTAEFGG